MTIYDDSIRHRVELEKLKNEVANRNIKRFLSIYNSISVFFNSLDNIKTNTLIKEINKIIDSENRSIKKDLIEDNISIAQYESKFQSLLISKLSNDTIKTRPISKELAKTLVLDNFMNGQLFDKTWNKLNDDFKYQVEQNVRMAVINGETGREAASRIKGSFNIKSNQLNSLTRTLIQNVVNLTDEEEYKDNDNIIKKVRYVAIMDSRTTDICKSLNGKIFNVGEGPRPPQHFNCRSFTIPILDLDEDDIPEDKNYNDWYERQEDKTGLKSKDKEKFITDEKITLKQLERKL